MTEPGRSVDLRARLRELRVFEGEMPTFNVSEAPKHPAELFLSWLLSAIDDGVREPHAMTISTVDAQGRPSSRVLILKGVSDGRWEFASSRLSRKGRELESNPWAALSFYWSEQGRQIRIRGRVLAGGADQGAGDFLARSGEARAAALSGTQSGLLHSCEDLQDALTEARARLAREPDLVAPDWTVYGLAADEVEFWQAHPERRHVRLRYLLGDGIWRRERLWP